MLFMMFLITVVYLRDWYHHLNSVVLQVEEKNTLVSKVLVFNCRI